MMRLKSKLLSLNASKTDKVKVFSPRNCEELRIPFKTDKTAKVVGKLASIPQPLKMSTDDSQEPQLITGVLVQNDFKMSLMAPEDLREYAGLTTTTIACKQRLRLTAAGIDLVKWGLEGTFGSIEELPEAKPQGKSSANGDDKSDADTKMEDDVDEEFTIDEVIAAYLVMGCVTVRYRASGEVELEWEGNMLNDGIADAVMAVLLGIESSPAAVKRKPLPPFSYPTTPKLTPLPPQAPQAKTPTPTAPPPPTLPSPPTTPTPTSPPPTASSAS
jgi:cleavage and polyadenylation specificity factor subunit 3